MKSCFLGQQITNEIKMSNKWERVCLRNQANEEKTKQNDCEAYRPNYRPIHSDKPSVVIRSGQAKYEKSNSLFGAQKITGQVKLNFHPTKKTKKDCVKKVIDLQEKNTIE